MGITNEVGRDNVVIMESQHSLHLILGRILDLLANGLVIRTLVQHRRQIHHTDVGGRHTERHARQLAIQIGNDLTHRLGSTGTTGNNVVTRGASSPPILLRRSIHRLLRGGNGVHRRHERLLDSELVIDHLGHGSQTVGRTGGVGYNIHAVLVLLVVDSHDEHGSVAGGSGDDDLLGPAGYVHAGLFGGGEDSRGFDDVVGSSVAPGDFGGVHLAVDLDGFAIDGEGLGVLVVGDGLTASAVDGVVLVHVLHVIDRDEGIIDGDNVHIRLVGSRAHNQAPDAPKSVDSNIDRHDADNRVL
mmetsp:Transcript_9739/g.15630  ORF Transcript_9739/g.15630 Transcript_9739/m.15630 type:complete len:300 (+) Transcript_9739:228-1127(+)